MIILIAGATHTGKTVLAQKLLETYQYPYLSIDHLKMGLIRSGNTTLTPQEDEKLTPYLWNITAEIIKTAIENAQNLIIEGCYIPFDWQERFTAGDLKNIKYICLIMTKEYIERNFDLIKSKASTIEQRLDDADLNKDELIKENEYNLKMAKKYALPYLLIDKEYSINTDNML